MSQRIQRATKTLSYPALRGVVDNPEQHHADLKKSQISDVFLQAKKMTKELQNIQYRLATLDTFRSKMFRKPLPTRIMKKGAAIFEKQDSEQERTNKRRKILTFTFRREVWGAFTDRIIKKLANRLQTSFYLSYLCQQLQKSSS